MIATTLAFLVGLAQIAPIPAQTPAQIRWAVAVFPSGDEFALEIAADPVAQSRGYMFREYVGPREGMLFIHAGTGMHSFWMKNCKVPLDMIWLDESFTVVEIAREQQPCPEVGECPSIFPMRATRFVIEVAGGVTREQGLEVGDRVFVHSDPPIVP